MIKDEAGGKHMTKFVELRGKFFSYLTQGYRPPPPKPLWEKCEGVKKSVVNKRITFNDYKEFLFCEKEKMRRMNIIRSDKREM